MSVAVITVCETCRYSAESKTREDGLAGGEIFSAAVEAAAGRAKGVTVRRTACLMGCDHHCNVGLQQAGKIAYVLGGFAPTPDAAAALVDYAEKYAASETGRVPYREWPQGVKGRFVSRLPPLD